LPNVCEFDVPVRHFRRSYTAFTLGYNSVSGFAGIVRKHTGMTPSTLARAIRSG
jgi:AraC-like DNA-binding protein